MNHQMKLDQSDDTGSNEFVRRRIIGKAIVPDCCALVFDTHRARGSFD